MVKVTVPEAKAVAHEMELPHTYCQVVEVSVAGEEPRGYRPIQSVLVALDASRLKVKVILDPSV